MTEEEKMRSGVIYAPGAPELARLRARAKKLVFDYNATSPENTGRLQVLLKELLGCLPEGIHLEPPFYCDYGCYIKAGAWFYANHNCVILDAGGVEIGEDVLFGPNVGIYTSGHPLDPALRASGQEYALPVRIGDRVWLGGNVVVNPGVTIGENSVIGSGSVVTRDIPANVIAAGNPCRVLRSLEPGMKERFRTADELLGL